MDDNRLEVTVPVVRIPDASKVDGQFPFDANTISEKRRWAFTEWYPRCCMACSVNRTHPTPRSPSGFVTMAVEEDVTSPAMDIGNGSNSMDVEQTPDFNDVAHIDDLPEHVLVRIFSYLHPIDCVHSASPVCKRWNRIAKSHRLCREVRIFVCDPPFYRKSVTDFLHEAGDYIEKISVDIYCTKPFTERDFIKLFPPVMPSVKVLDIGFFSNLTIAVLKFFIQCFPNLERLNAEGMKKVDNEAFSVLFTEGFPKLKELVLSHCESLTASEYDLLCSVARPLEVLSVDGIFTLQNFGAMRLASAPFAGSLSRLYLDGEDLFDTGFRALTCCHNLKLLSVSFCESATDLALGYIKTLSKLEHLHLRKGKDFTADGLKTFFTVSADPKVDEFPRRLKFLNIGECHGVNDVVIDVITSNCPQLQSLCLVWCYSVTDAGLACIVHRLHDLVFLDVRGLDCINGEALMDVPEKFLTKLRYLGAEQCPQIDDSLLQMLNVQKKDLIITNYHNYFITFTVRDGIASFRECFERDFQEAVNRELSRYDGFCCMSDMQ